jgi:hypothetical protein
MAHVNASINARFDAQAAVLARRPPQKTPSAGATQAQSSAAKSAPGSGANAPAAPDFRALFSGTVTPAVTDPGPPPAPTAESAFGANPWLTSPMGQGPGGAYAFNPFYFATPQTAAKVAAMVGGTVVQSNQFTPTGGSFAQSQPNQMVQLADGRLINPGLVASFYTHGYPQSYIDRMIAAEVRNA